MPLDFTPIQNYWNKFYKNENSSKGFQELSEEQLSELSKRVDTMKEKMSSTLPEKSDDNISKLERYQKTMQYLTNPLIHLDLNTFDERMAYLITMIDPNLVTFKEFLKLDLISKTEIAKTTDEQERNRLTNIRKQTISTYKSIVREKIGFFDSKLLKYEEIFFKRFFNEQELITEVGNNNQDNLIIKAKSLKDFNSISDKRYQELINIAQTWLSLVPEKNNYKVAAYSITNQSKLLGLNNIAEQLVLFILLIDNDLDMLRIYEEESMFPIIKERIIEQFGFFDKELLVLEKKFHDRFCPNKQLSVWTKINKR